MGYLRVSKLNEYLVDPLMDALKDESAYVRKTAVTCIPKVMEISKALLLAQNIPLILNDILETDENASVVAAALISLKEIANITGKPLYLDIRSVNWMFWLIAGFSE